MNELSVIVGIHAVRAVLTTQPERVVRLMILKERLDQKMQHILELAASHSIKIESVTRQTLDEAAHQANHQGILAYCQKAKRFTEADLEILLDHLESPALLLILDNIQDPHNLGACLRSADAAGVHAVIAPKDKSVGLTPTVAKVASGALETIPFIQVTNLARTLRMLKERNIWVFGADEAAKKTLYQADFTSSAAFVLGAEGTGLRRLTREHCDMLLNIPMQGSVSSLNVSVAAGVFLFEALRQRRLG